MSGKSEWPEVVGKNVEEAKEIILKDRSNVWFREIPENMCIKMAPDDNRVRLYVNAKGIVKQALRG